MTKAERLEAQHAAIRELIERASRRTMDTSWTEIAWDMADDLARALKFAKREEAKALAGQVATEQQPA